MTDEKILIPLAISLLGVLIGSYLSSLLKLYLYAPSRLIYWLTSTIIFAVLIKAALLKFSIEMAALYTVLVLGGQVAYDKVFKRLWTEVNSWHKRKR